MTKRWDRVTIIGCGLIGASFALGLRRADAVNQIAGWDAAELVLAEAIRAGVIDEPDDAFAAETISASDLIYLAMPVGEIVDFLQKGAPQVKPGAVITDAGSTKVDICRAAAALRPTGRHFVGGHPVAGSHLGGLQHARADLFAGAPYVVISDNKGDSQPAIVETVRLLGADVTVMTAAEHDRAMAFVSHVPQIVSNVLAAVTRDQPDAEDLLRLSGSGYRDMTRLSGSSWSIWRDILATNSSETANALEAVIRQLTSVRDELQQSDRGTDLRKTRNLFGNQGPTRA